jgi:hypothetical protein
MPKKILMTIIAILLCVPTAQTSAQQSGEKTAPITSRPDRTTADPATRKKMQEKRSALRVKRDACIKEFKVSKVSLLKRNKFINECMAKS